MEYGHFFRVDLAYGREFPTQTITYNHIASMEKTIQKGADQQ
jgi:hypothetical protein